MCQPSPIETEKDLENLAGDVVTCGNEDAALASVDVRSFHM